MKLRTIGITILVIAFAQATNAYNHRKCMIGTKDYAEPLGTFFSTSSFFTSTGDCAMLGSITERKQQFLAMNIDQMKVDLARGQGEYLSAYASLSGCSVNATQKLGVSLQSNYIKVFGQALDHSPEQAYGQIERVISSDPELLNSCRPKA